MKNNNDSSSLCNTVTNKVLLLIVGLGCALAGATAQAVDVNINFDADACPIGVSSVEVTVSKSAADKVQWISYNADGTEPVPIRYQIFFDPFKGKSLESDANGKVTSKPVDGGVPVNVVFKYTVYNPDCPDKPLDPQIRVRR